MKKKLLFVEDYIITGSVYRYHFISAGYKTEVADNGENAIAALASFEPDIVVLDLLLPKINGVEVLKRIRANPKTAATPVVVFTNAYASDLGRQAQAVGANRFLNKAKTSYAGLLDAVREVLDAAAAKKDLLAAGQPSASEPSSRAPATKVPLNPRDEFLQRAQQTLTQMRRLVQDLRKEPSDQARAGLVLELARKVHFLTALAALGEAHLLAQMASALEVLLKQVHERLQNLSDSSLRTNQHASELLGALFNRASSNRPGASPLHKVLVVDDDPVSRKLIAAALEIAQLQAENLDDPKEAYQKLRQSRYDLVITDVRMPGMSGFDLCEKLRALPDRSQTPAIFVTAASDFTARVRSAESGGDDFIAKPFLAIELVVKALSQLLRGGLQNPLFSFQPFHPQA